MNEQVKNNIMEYKQKYLQKLTDAQVPEKLEKQLEEMDWSCLELIHQKKQQRGTFAPLQATELSEIRKKEDLYRETGLKALREGKVGAILLAGGQGTRLGFDKAKGMFNIGVTKTLYIFEQLIKNLMQVKHEAGVWIPLFGWQLNPMFGAAAMSLSSFCVVTNALRLNLFRMYDVGKDRRIKNAVTGQTAAAAAKEPDDALEKKSETNQKKENETMKKTMKINGMMCGHCEARVKKALEAVEGVQEAVVSHEAGNAVVTLSSDVADEVLKKAVEDQDYEVVSVES